MAPNEKPQKEPPQSTPKSLTKRYVLKPQLHPNKWKLQLKDSSGQIIYEILRRLTIPIQYRVKTNQLQESNPLTIKTVTIGDIQRYTFFEGNQAKLSIRQSASSKLVLLQDAKRKIIAHFISITPEITLLRAQTNVIAHLRFKENPTPVGFVVDCHVQPELKWLHAILLYVIAKFEEPKSSTSPVEPLDVESENNPSEAASP